MERLRIALVALLLVVCGPVQALIPKAAGYEWQAYGTWYPTSSAACARVASEQAAIPGVLSVTNMVAHETLPYHCSYTIVRASGSTNTTSSLTRRNAAAACPANSTEVSGGCQCNAGYKENATSTACEVDTPQCRPGNVISSGFYDYGAQASGNPPIYVCSGGCGAIFTGEVPAGSAIVGGTKHFFARGEYTSTGTACESSDANVPSAGSGLPADSCGPNQTMGTINGATKCYWTQGSGSEGEPNTEAPTNEPDKAKNPETSSQTTTNTVNNTNCNGCTTTTTTTVVNNGNGTSTTTTKTSEQQADGSVKETTTTKTEGKQTDEQAKQSKCEKNPAEAGCGGAPKPVQSGGLYAEKGKTVTGVLTAAKNTLTASGVGAAVTGFFSVGGGGTCPRSSGEIPFINATVSFDLFCSDFAALLLLGLRSVLLVLAAWFAFRIAME